MFSISTFMLSLFALLITFTQPVMATAAWQKISASQAGVLAIDPINTQIMYSNRDGVSKSTDGGASWISVNSEIRAVYALVIDPTNAQTLYAGTGGDGVYKTTNGGSSWYAVNNGLNNGILCLAIDPITPQTIYAGTAASGGVFKSTNGGASWSAINIGLTNTYVMSIAIDPTNTQILYVGTYGGGVFKSTDGGASWSAVDIGLTYSHFNLFSLVIDPTNTQNVYAASTYVLHKSTDGGASWSISFDGRNYSWTAINNIAIDPNVPQTVYITTSGYGVFKSLNGGITWSTINSGLPYNPNNYPFIGATSLVINPTNSHTLYVEASDGLYKEVSNIDLPSISGTPSTSVAVGTTYSFTPKATNATNFSISNKPTWGQFDTATGTLSGTPSSNDVGIYSNIIITAIYGNQSADLSAFSVTVLATTYNVSITNYGTGSGTFTFSTGGGCAGNCSQLFNGGTVITLTPSAAAGSLFAGWIGCDSLSGSQCTVTMNSDKNIQAYFSLIPAQGEEGFTPLESFMSIPRDGHTATALMNGKILLAGGRTNAGVKTNTAELYDPTTKTFFPVPGAMTSERYGHSAILLPNGKVLLSGGDGLSGINLTADIFDPVQNTFVASNGLLADCHRYGTSVLLPNGKVLIVGGGGPNAGTQVADIYDPLLDTFTPTANRMNRGRFSPTATLLQNGTVLIAGGRGDYSVDSDPASGIINAEIYDSNTDTFALVQAPMQTPRYSHSATLLPNGTVLIAGGGGGIYDTTDSRFNAEIYDPVASTFTSTLNDMSSHGSFHSASLMLDGRVLIAGGFDGVSTKTVDIYDPATGIFSKPAVEMSLPRRMHTATLLKDGSVLITGGFQTSLEPQEHLALNRAEIYKPVNYLPGTPNENSPVPPGINITVTPTPYVQFTFDTVTTGGNIAATTLNNPSPPANFRILTGSSYEITTTAAFTGSVSVCMNYSEAVLADRNNESRIRLFHRNGSNWEDITSSVDTINNRICGVTTSFSPFAIGEPTTYTVTATASGSGSITPSGETIVAAGGSQTYTFTPNPGNKIAYVTVGVVNIGAVNSYSFSNIQMNQSIGVYFTPIKYTITATVGANGSISPGTSSYIGWGTNKTYTITPAAGYRVDTLIVDNVAQTPATSYTFANVTNDHIISATFAANPTYTITASATGSGTITPIGDSQILGGQIQTYSITPNAGQRIEKVIVDGVNKGSITSYTFGNVQANHNIEAYFVINSFTVTATANGTNGGTVTNNVDASIITGTGSGSNLVPTGQSITYTFTPNPGNKIAYVTVGAVNKGVISSYTFSNIQMNQSIGVYFTPIKYTITATAGANGSISPGTSSYIGWGTNKTYTITPKAGYHVETLTVDGVTQTPATSYIFTNVIVDHSISATFAPNPSYTISASAGTGGSISPSGDTQLLGGLYKSFSIAPSTGYKIEKVLVDGVNKGTITSYTFTNVNEGHTIAASFIPL